MVPYFHSGILEDLLKSFFSRFVEHQSILPYNNSTARIAGEHVMFASGYTF